VRKQLPRIVGAGAVALVVLVYAVCFVVNEEEGVLVETLGSVTRTLKSPEDTGLHLAWPWPVQKIHRYDLRQRLHTEPLVQVSTADSQLLVAGALALWRIGDLAAFRNAVAGNEFGADALITGPLRNAVNSAFSRRRFADIVGTAGPDDGDPVLEAMERTIAGELARTVGSYGIRIEDVGFYRLVLPARATTGVFEQMREAKERDAARQETLGRAIAEETRAKAERAYQEGIQEAAAAAGTIVAEAQAEVARLLAEAENRGLVAFLNELDAFKEIFSRNTRIVLDPGTPPLDLLRTGEGGDEE
jgi:membrane protease subunit HflC